MTRLAMLLKARGIVAGADAGGADVGADVGDGAEYWLLSAAAAGNADAMYGLGELRYEQGIIDGLDGSEHWFRRACDLGLRRACERLH
jgi:TPR repeat protein